MGSSCDPNSWKEMFYNGKMGECREILDSRPLLGQHTLPWTLMNRLKQGKCVREVTDLVVTEQNYFSIYV